MGRRMSNQTLMNFSLSTLFAAERTGRRCHVGTC